jgi:hypothetical protein
MVLAALVQLEVLLSQVPSLCSYPLALQEWACCLEDPGEWDYLALSQANRRLIQY